MHSTTKVNILGVEDGRVKLSNTSQPTVSIEDVYNMRNPLSH